MVMGGSLRYFKASALCSVRAEEVEAAVLRNVDAFGGLLPTNLG